MELWTDTDIAEKWGITPGRARMLMSARNIARVSGYPAVQVKAVQRRRGARTDLSVPTNAVTLTQTATAIAGQRARSDRLRVFFEFMRGAVESGPGALALVDAEPPFTGDVRFDALLAGAAEFVCARLGEPGPLWTVADNRWLSRAWWIPELVSGRAQALVWCPGGFRRRGIYIDRRDLFDDGGEGVAEPLFGRREVLDAFTLLASKLERRSVVGQVHVIGGAAMLLAFDARSITRDIDALFSPDGPVRDAVREIAAEKGWPSTWLNDQAAMYVARKPGLGAVVFDHPYLQVMSTPLEHLLAMKVLSARSIRDREDVELLLDRLNITAVQSVWDIVGRYFPDEGVSDRSRLFVEDIMEIRGRRR